MSPEILNDLLMFCIEKYMSDNIDIGTIINDVFKEKNS